MSQDKLQRQEELPASIQLFRYNPERLQFNWKFWDPAKVRTAKDLPNYLILGSLDKSTFEITNEGWSAIWQGTEDNTYFKVKYLAEKERYEINQKWCGVDGGISMYTSKIPLGKIIAERLYIWFPWDSEAKNTLEQKYQITYFEQPKEYPTMCGIPDGTFKTIAFPVLIRNLRPVREWLQKITSDSNINYPISAEAKLLFQAINYLEGKAPDWTTNKTSVFISSLDETGIVPFDFPVRETAPNGSSAWTLRREVYVLFIRLPFAGLTDFLERMVTAIYNGPIRLRDAEPLRVQMQPIVIPPMTEYMSQNISFYDKEQTTRCYLQFFKPGEAPPIPSINDLIHGEAVADDLLLKTESISADVTESIHESLISTSTKGINDNDNAN